MKALAELRDQILDEILTDRHQPAILPWGYWFQPQSSDQAADPYSREDLYSREQVWGDPMWREVRTILREEIDSFDPAAVSDSRDRHRFNVIGRPWLTLREHGERPRGCAMRALVLGAYALRELLESVYCHPPEGRDDAAVAERIACNRIALVCGMLSGFDERGPHHGLILTCSVVGGFPGRFAEDSLGLGSRASRRIVRTHTANLRDRLRGLREAPPVS